jgi:DNA polymerase-4
MTPNNSSPIDHGPTADVPENAARDRLEQAQSKMQDGVSAAMKYWENSMAFGQSQLAAMMQSSQIMAIGLQEISKHIVDNNKASFEESVAFTKSLITAKTPQDAAQLQAGFVKATLAKGVAQNRQIAASKVFQKNSGIGRAMPAFCRDCDGRQCDAEDATTRLCPGCGSARIVRHPELFRLAIAHVDCDAFYASVEKRGRPELSHQPVIVGGGTRGVVTTCCYVARLYGVRSAMPMFKALALCPQAVIIRPDMAKYAAVSAQVRQLMDNLTPLVQLLSIDEAVLDLSGTEALHGRPPAIMLNRFARLVEASLGITVSIGLSHNRLLAKLAAERGKPRGFAVFGTEAAAILAPEPVSVLPGIGPAQAKRLHALGLTRIGQLAALPDRVARQKLGDEGPAMAARARGEDVRVVHTRRVSKSVSAETTFDTDISAPAELETYLWQLCEKLGRRLRDEAHAAAGIVLKLKTADFISRTRGVRLANPTQLPETLFDAAKSLLSGEADGTVFRLIGIGASPLADSSGADLGDLADTATPRRAARQAAIDTLRNRFGNQIVTRGTLREKKPLF